MNEKINTKIVKVITVLNIIFGVVYALISVASKSLIFGIMGLYLFMLGLFLMLGTKILGEIEVKK